MQADGLLLATPEYNNSMPGVLKNAVDWRSRPPADVSKVFGGRPVALMGASPGGFGTILSQNAWLPVLQSSPTRPSGLRSRSISPASSPSSKAEFRL